MVCDLLKNALLRDGNQNDRADARNLAELLRTNQVQAVYHGKHGIRTLRELGRSYLALTKDTTRVMNRIKSVYRSWAIPCAGTSVYSRRHRAEWLAKLAAIGKLASGLPVIRPSDACDHGPTPASQFCLDDD